MTWTTLPRSDNASLAWHETGAGSPLLLIHGVGLCAESWGAQIAHFRKTHRVFAVDLPGHGESPRLDVSDPTVEDYASCIVRFLQDIVAEPAVLIGHSMGAMIALDIAARRTRLCKGVAALNAVYRRSPEAARAVQHRATQLQKTEDLAAAPVNRWFGESPIGDAAVAADHCRRWLQQTNRDGYGRAYQAFARHDGPSSSALQHITVPALFATGSEDLNSTPAMADAMAAQCMLAEALSVPQAGHMMQMTHPDTINTVLTGHVGRSFGAESCNKVSTTGRPR